MLVHFYDPAGCSLDESEEVRFRLDRDAG